MPRKKISLRQLAESIGMNHLAATELLRRIAGAVDNEDEETIVITQQVGTFYLQKRKATQRTLNGVVYDVPARNVIQLDPPQRKATEATTNIFIGTSNSTNGPEVRSGALRTSLTNRNIPIDRITRIRYMSGNISGPGTLGGVTREQMVPHEFTTSILEPAAFLESTDSVDDGPFLTEWFVDDDDVLNIPWTISGELKIPSVPQAGYVHRVTATSFVVFFDE